MTVQTAPDAGTLGVLINTALRAYQDNSTRSLQTQIGASALGFCRQSAKYTIEEQQPTDSKSMAAAAIGTAIHAYASEAIKATFPQWESESLEVVATFPNGAEIKGHPDIIVREWNLLLDIKTKDGFTWVKREGVSGSNLFQLTAYVLGAVQAGILDKDKPITVGIVYIDRSGNEEEPYVVTWEFDWSVVDQVNGWIEDVIYAVQHGEDASRDIAAPVCEKICAFYSKCRGSLPEENPDLITDPTAVAAVEAYVEAREMEKQAKALKTAAQKELLPFSGSTGDWQVRWTTVNPTVVPSFEKAGHMRLDVRAVRKVQSD